ncbi:alpha/beta fold hydrolase [Pararhodobacter marinus]|uniref:alpha/beta fold hydrolase n=1 Tax=Pararhodobacter marinus TaxID=2184063 RepID=UPI0035140338
MPLVSDRPRFSRLMPILAALTLLTCCGPLVDERADNREAQWEAEYPPLGHFVEVEGHRVHLIERGRPRGTAPDIVLIHGANGNVRDFTIDLVSRLEADYRVIALDRPGLGYSDSWGPADSDPRLQARVLRDAAEQIGLDRPIVLGHSYGGAVATAWALEAPQDTAALVLLAAALEPWDGTLSFWYDLNQTALGAPVRSALSAFTPEAAIEAPIAKVFEPEDPPEGYAEAFGAVLSLRRASQAANNRQINDLLSYITEMSEDYDTLTLPIEMLHGEEDQIVGIDIHARPFAARVPSAHLVTLPGAGHMIQHTRLDAVLEAIDRATRRAGYGG